MPGRSCTNSAYAKLLKMSNVNEEIPSEFTEDDLKNAFTGDVESDSNTMLGILLRPQSLRENLERKSNPTRQSSLQSTPSSESDSQAVADGTRRSRRTHTIEQVKPHMLRKRRSIEPNVGSQITPTTTTSVTRTPSPVEPTDFFQFEVLDHHIVNNGRREYRCDICELSYRYPFSLKRHFLRNHINFTYLTDSDIVSCGINATKSPVVLKWLENPTIKNVVDGDSLPISKRENEISVATESNRFLGLYCCHTCLIFFNSSQSLYNHHLSAHCCTEFFQQLAGNISDNLENHLDGRDIQPKHSTPQEPPKTESTWQTRTRRSRRSESRETRSFFSQYNFPQNFDPESVYVYDDDDDECGGGDSKKFELVKWSVSPSAKGKRIVCRVCNNSSSTIEDFYTHHEQNHRFVCAEFIEINDDEVPVELLNWPKPSTQGLLRRCRVPVLPDSHSVSTTVTRRSTRDSVIPIFCTKCSARFDSAMALNSHIVNCAETVITVESDEFETPLQIDKHESKEESERKKIPDLGSSNEEKSTNQDKEKPLDDKIDDENQERRGYNTRSKRRSPILDEELPKRTRRPQTPAKSDSDKNDQKPPSISPKSVGDEKDQKPSTMISPKSESNDSGIESSRKEFDAIDEDTILEMPSAKFEKPIKEDEKNENEKSVDEKKKTDIWKVKEQNPQYAFKGSPAQYHHCPYCRRGFTYLANYRRHIDDDCPLIPGKMKQESEKISIDENEKPFIAGSVEQNTWNETKSEISVEGEDDLLDVKENQEAKSKFRSYSCNICHKIFLSLVQMLKHRVSHKLAANGVNISCLSSTCESTVGDQIQNTLVEQRISTQSPDDVNDSARNRLLNKIDDEIPFVNMLDLTRTEGDEQIEVLGPILSGSQLVMKQTCLPAEEESNQLGSPRTLSDLEPMPALYNESNIDH